MKVSLLSDRLGVTVPSEDTSKSEKISVQPPKKEKPPKKDKKNKIKEKKNKKTENLLVDVTSISELEDLKTKNIEEVAQTQEAEKRSFIKNKIGIISLSILCVYLIFLIFGAFMTPFYRQSKGTKAYPIVMSVQDIKNKAEFDKVYELFLEAKNIYEDVIMIDYRLSLNTESSALIAADYTAMLDRTSNLYTAITATTFQKKYAPVIAVLKTWVYTDMPVYLQNVSNALVLNDTNKAQQAIVGQTVVETNFMTLKNNIISLSDGIKAVDLTEIEEWSVEKYRKEQIGFATKKE